MKMNMALSVDDVDADSVLIEFDTAKQARKFLALLAETRLDKQKPKSLNHIIAVLQQLELEA